VAADTDTVALYRPSRTFFLIRLFAGFGILAFGLYGLLSYAQGSESSLQGQYWFVALVGVAWPAFELWNHYRFPLSTVLSNDDLLLEYARTNVRFPVSEIAGVGIARRALRASLLITWHVWQPACWTNDGSIHVAPGIMSLGGNKSTEEVLRSRSGKVARDLYGKIRELQGEGGLVETHRRQADPGSLEVLIEILDYPSHEGRWIFRWDAGSHNAK
jgi:hypothetical protein